MVPYFSYLNSILMSRKPLYSTTNIVIILRSKPFIRMFFLQIYSKVGNSLNVSFILPYQDVRVGNDT